MQPAPGQWHLDLIGQLHEELENERVARAHAQQQAELGLNLLYRRQAELGLMAAIARTANESADLDAALETTLRLMCEFGDWEVGHILSQPLGEEKLRTTHAWYSLDRLRLASFIDTTERHPPSPGEDLPGEVLATGQVAVRPWPVDTDTSPRAATARQVGIVFGFAFHVPAGAHGGAVVELYSYREHPASELLRELVPQIAAQLGRLLERHWSSEQVRRAQVELEAKVRERTETLASTVVELNKQMGEQRRMQQALQLHDRALAAAANGIVLVSALEGHRPIVYVNPAFERLTGFGSAEVVGRSYTSIRTTGDDSDDSHALDLVFQQARTGKRGEITVKSTRKDGSWFWNHLTISPVRDNHGLLTHYVAILEDVTETRRSAELMRKAKETTEAANAELSRAARLKDEFLAAMSHELRTPLNAILGLTQALIEDVYGQLADEQRTALRTVDESGRHLLDLINDILDLSKVESKKLVLQIDEMDVSAVVESSLRFTREAALKKRLTVSSRIAPEVPLFFADQRRVKQMLVNLLSNAVKFTPAGGSVGLEVDVDFDTQTVRFVVWDTGIGIAEADLPKLFQTFVQVDSRLARNYGGTGLGLALVRGMARLHGGDASVESELGKGSRFFVTLPLKIAAAPVSPDPRRDVSAAPSSSDTRPPMLKGGRILLAEDNDLNRRTFVDYLAACGHTTATAVNGEEAVRLAAELKPDLILMDVQMPKMDGLEATRRIRATPEIAQTPIIALTALAMVGDDVRCMQAGVDKYLSKPVNLRELNTVINEFLARPRRRQATVQN